MTFLCIIAAVCAVFLFACGCAAKPAAQPAETKAPQASPDDPVLAARVETCLKKYEAAQADLAKCRAKIQDLQVQMSDLQSKEKDLRDQCENAQKNLDEAKAMLEVWRKSHEFDPADPGEEMLNKQLAEYEVALEEARAVLADCHDMIQVMRSQFADLTVREEMLKRRCDKAEQDLERARKEMNQSK
jgi:peptidoglycan hydrolase CwlO-like protein